jgi:hypothetical protein
MYIYMMPFALPLWDLGPGRRSDLLEEVGVVPVRLAAHVRRLVAVEPVVRGLWAFKAGSPYLIRRLMM